MDWGTISRNVGIALIFNAAFMAFSAAVSGLYGFDSSFSPLLLSAIITFMFGIFPLIFVRRKKDINMKEGLATLLLAWFLSCLFGMLPYILWGGEFTVENAWFESTSGITTTGATILKDIEALPNGLLMWRSSCHFIGGLGVVVFIMLIMPSIGSVRHTMSKMEITDVSRNNYQYKSNKFLKVVISVYLGITVLSILALMIAGLPLFDAVNLGFSTVATGGFCIKNASVAAYDSTAVEIVVMIFMILSSLHFGLIYASIASRSTKIFKDPITNFYLATIVIAGILVSLNIFTSGVVDSPWGALRSGFFTVVASISTSGFNNSDYSNWPVFSLFILLYVMIQCGCSGSTSSGLRSDRVWILFKAGRVQLIKMAYPKAVVQVKSGHRIVEEEMLQSVSIFTIIFICIIIVFAMIYSLFGFDFIESLSTSVSMMSNIGPAFGQFNETFAEAPTITKYIMGIQMIIGRLGVYSVLMLFILFRRRLTWLPGNF